MLRRVLYGLLLVGCLWIPGRFALEGDWVGFFFVLVLGSAVLLLALWRGGRAERSTNGHARR